MQSLSGMMQEEISTFVRKTIDIFSSREIYLIKFYRIKLIALQPTEDELEEIYQSDQDRAQAATKKFNEFQFY